VLGQSFDVGEFCILVIPEKKKKLVPFIERVFKNGPKFLVFERGATRE
jgi:hypothetical protein